VLCTGPRGAGKTCTAGALMMALTEASSTHGVSLARPGDLSFRPGPGVITSVEIPTHVPSFAEAVQQALALGARVIALSDLPDSATVLAALDAALSGACVITCVTANRVEDALEHVLDRIDATERARAREALAETVRLVLNQRLLVQAVGHGRVPAVEILAGTPQLSAMIRDDKLEQLAPLMASGKAIGVTTLDDALDELVQTGTITPAEARRVARKKERFKA
jgi:twitching motility protein PilT